MNVGYNRNLPLNSVSRTRVYIGMFRNKKLLEIREIIVEAAKIYIKRLG